MHAPNLHPKTVEEVRQKADIVEVIAEKVVLRKQGKNYLGLCPFHQDRKPSFNVSPSKQIYKCFSCGEGGDVLRFVMKQEGLSFSDTVLQLGRRYGVNIQTQSPEKKREYEQFVSRQDKLFEILYLATDFYQHVLRSPQGEAARRYLDKRHISAETQQTFQIGFAPPGWQPLYEYLVNQKRLPVKLLEDVGLVTPRSNGRGYYDRFRHRIILPIFDARGRVIGFGGRAMGDEQPKYLNSPETELFDKSQVLYGLNFARDAISKQDRAVVVEGYFDVISLHQAGIETAVAALGTALGPQQVKQLLRYSESKQTILNFDADAAGVKAAERAIASLKDLARRGEIQLRILTIPAGKDADEFLQENSREAYEQLIRDAPLWVDWQIQQALADKKLSNPVHFQQASQEVVRILSDLTDTMMRSHYLHRSAELLSRGDGRLALRLEEELRRNVRTYRWRGKDKPVSERAGRLQTSEGQLLQIYLHFAEHRCTIRAEMAERELQFNLAHHRILWQKILELIVHQAAIEQQEERLLNSLRASCAHDEQLNQRLSHLLWLDENTRVALMRPKMVVRAAIANMELEICQKRYRYWTQLWDKAYTDGDTDLARMYQGQIQAEHQKIQTLQKAAQLTFEELVQTPLLDGQL
ncbi:DNA primase [Synechococcus sp. PCC 7336]|uniref:DNA primase n=1 Tax=Synechococcus sp. PCC 7336 TaxID=195250 RepID=UPI00034DDEAD|nr:DNA primase [Synechococcus sp. PCC 7336]